MSTSLLSSACPVARSVPRALRRAYRSSASPSRLVHTRAKKKNDVLFGEETVPPLPPSYDSQDYSQDEPAEPACALAYASVDNEAHPEWSLLQVDVTAVSGVMRILSWLMNGLDLDVKSAEWDIEYGAAQGASIGGWEEKWSNQHERPYWTDPSTGESTWQNPHA